MQEPAFGRGAIDIGYWDRIGRDLMASPPDLRLVEDAALASALLEHERRTRRSIGSGGGALAASTGARGPAPWLEAGRLGVLRTY